MEILFLECLTSNTRKQTKTKCINNKGSIPQGDQPQKPTNCWGWHGHLPICQCVALEDH